MTNLTNIANLLTPLQNAVSLQSWEDAEDLASEISRLCRLKRLQEVQAIQEALGEKPQDCLISAPLENKTVLRGSQVANSSLPITLETRFDELGHPDPWRNELAKELNIILLAASYDVRRCFPRACLSIVTRVAQFEEIRFI